jgi:hypothetical protein
MGPLLNFVFPIVFFFQQVLELFFSNEAGQYIEIIVSPRGRYVIRMLTEEKGKDEPLFNSLPLFPSGVQNHNNPCLGGEGEEISK